MIKLKFNCQFSSHMDPFVGKMYCTDTGGLNEIVQSEGTLPCAYDEKRQVYRGKRHKKEFFIFCEPHTNLDGDIFLFVPEKEEARRLIRRGSSHNTILFTERCDQLCVMCSQPPMTNDDREFLQLWEQAICLADKNTHIGISGGEPTLYKDELLGMLERIALKRSDLSFHILSNAQFFTKADIPRLKNLHEHLKIIWGIPLYSASAPEHEAIVKKPGAFNVLLRNLFFIASSNGIIELRTVILKSNYFDLPKLGKFIGKNLNFIGLWAIMNIEPIGYAKQFKEEVFIDYSQFIHPLQNTLEIANLFSLNPVLYNFPLCTIPQKYWNLCADSISDWKKKFLATCDCCTQKKNCSGFFEWYNAEWAIAGVKPIH